MPWWCSCLRMVVFFFEDRLHHEYYSYECVIRHQAKIRGEHMRTCVHAHTETPPANKITKKIRKKQRWPSEKKSHEHLDCSNAYMCTCAHTQRNHSLTDCSNSASQICRYAGCVRADLLFFSFFSEGNRPHACLTFF